MRLPPFPQLFWFIQFILLPPFPILTYLCRLFNVNTFKALLYTSQSTALRFSSSCAQLFVIQPTLDTKSAMPNSMALTPYGSNGSTDLTMAVLGCGKYSEDEHIAAWRTPVRGWL